MDVLTEGRLRIDPGALDSAGASELEIVIPHTEWRLTVAVLQRAAALAAGLNVRIQLVAVHVSAYPAAIGCPTLVHARLVRQLVELSETCSLPVNPLVVMARYWDEGFRYAMKPNSTALIGTRSHLWRTHEEKLAQLLAREGHHVILLHIDKG